MITEVQKSLFDVSKIRLAFPALSQSVKGKPLVYFDNAATTQKPFQVIDAVSKYYRLDNSNIHRGVHELSERATAAYEAVRENVRGFINAASTKEIIFVRGTTEGINLVAQSFAKGTLQSGDEVVISGLEHHSNIVPWQMVCGEKNALLKVAPINDAGEILIDEYEKLLTKRTKLVAIGHVSNALGTVNPVKSMIAAAHAKGIAVLVDGAQAMAHMRVDVRDLDADFYVFSGHKMFGPTGIGVLYGKESMLNSMPPYQGGGDMIKSVTFDKTIYNDLPYKFEAGTPNIAGTIGLGAAIEYLAKLDIEAMEAYEGDLLSHAATELGKIKGVRLVGTAREKLGVISFLIDSVHPHDIGTILNEEGIAIRTGHHCAQPVMDRFGISATARASFAFYNTRDEIDVLVRGIHRVQEVFS